MSRPRHILGGVDVEAYEIERGLPMIFMSPGFHFWEHWRLRASRIAVGCTLPPSTAVQERGALLHGWARRGRLSIVLSAFDHGQRRLWHFPRDRPAFFDEKRFGREWPARPHPVGEDFHWWRTLISTCRPEVASDQARNLSRSCSSRSVKADKFVGGEKSAERDQRECLETYGRTKESPNGLGPCHANCPASRQAGPGAGSPVEKGLT